jgi:hypothetical protein
VDLFQLVVLLVGVGTLGFLVRALTKGIRQERRSGDGLWDNFGLSLSLLILFAVTWIGHGLSEWQEYKSEQEEHGQPVEVQGFLYAFEKSSFENWQSEFLQLFAFVVLAGLYIHKGSAESKDGEEEIKQRLNRIEKKLGELAEGAGSRT